MEAKQIIGGKYELGKTIGQGTFAKVKRGRNLETGSAVAVKVIEKDRVLNGGKAEQIKREISIMKLVRHPNVVQLYEVMATKRKIFFVMEYVTGGELFDRIVYQTRLKENEAISYFRQLIHALSFCHARGVCHRDLKPENLLLDSRGALKIADFGLSALPDQARQDGLLHTACGTPAYVAPEVILNRGYDGAKADLWSCGVILFVLLAGYLPFSDANLRFLYRKIEAGRFKCPPWFSPSARKLVHRLLEPDPRRRMTMQQLMDYPWLGTGCTRPLKHSIAGDFQEDAANLKDAAAAFSFTAQIHNKNNNKDKNGNESEERESVRGLINAFELISLSPGLNLSGLFEERQESRFTCELAASELICKLQEIGRRFGLSIKSAAECKVRLQGGLLAIVAQVFQVAPSLLLVELCNGGGDALEYHKFFVNKLRPALSGIVCAWALPFGDSNSGPTRAPCTYPLR